MNVLNLKDILSIKLKSRQDSYSDQWNRILVSKLFLITAVIVTIDYFQDEVSCIIPTSAEIDIKFVQSTCWITGFYIYPELKNRVRHVAYHGIPKDLSLNGLNKEDKLCATLTKYGELDSDCKPMRREYYLQYQWYPFFLGTVSVMYYLPYLLFYGSNRDIRSLKQYLEAETSCPNEVVRLFFNYVTHPKNTMRLRLVITCFVKLLYIFVNVFVFKFLDFSLNYKFAKFGYNFLKWIQWSPNSSHALKERGYAKPGNELLPPVGLCDVHDSFRDIRNTRMNSHKFICEISPHILYQYCFLMVWLILVVTTIISIFGLGIEVANCCSTLFCYVRRKKSMEIYRLLTLRECQYLEMIRQKDPAFYGKVIQRLNAARMFLNTSQENRTTEILPQPL